MNKEISDYAILMVYLKTFFTRPLFLLKLIPNCTSYFGLGFFLFSLFWLPPMASFFIAVLTSISFIINSLFMVFFADELYLKGLSDFT